MLSSKLLTVFAIVGGGAAVLYALYRLSKNPPSLRGSYVTSRDISITSSGTSASASANTFEAQLQSLFEKSVELRLPKEFDSRKAFSSLPRSASCCICNKSAGNPKAKMSINWHRQVCCSSHESVPCASCGRFASAPAAGAEPVCATCAPNALTGASGGQRLVRLWRDLVSQLRLAPAQRYSSVPVQLASASRLAELSRGHDFADVHLEALTCYETVLAGVSARARDQVRVTSVSVLHGRTPLVVGKLLAHELGHVMLAFEHISLPKDEAEAFCELLSYVWLSSRVAEDDTASYHRWRVACHPQQQWAVPLKTLLDALHSKRLTAATLLSHIRTHHRLPKL